MILCAIVDWYESQLRQMIWFVDEQVEGHIIKNMGASKT